VTSWEEFTSEIEQHPEEQIDLMVKRGDETTSLSLVPREAEDVEGKTIGQAGIYQVNEKSIIKTFKWRFETTYETTVLIIKILFMLITCQLSLDMLSGPVGIYDATDQIVKTGFMPYLLWTAMLSINLGIINLVPLPALDGGRLLFVGIEAVRGKP